MAQIDTVELSNLLEYYELTGIEITLAVLVDLTATEPDFPLTFNIGSVVANEQDFPFAVDFKDIAITYTVTAVISATAIQETAVYTEQQIRSVFLLDKLADPLKSIMSLSWRQGSFQQAWFAQLRFYNPIDFGADPKHNTSKLFKFINGYAPVSKMLAWAAASPPYAAGDLFVEQLNIGFNKVAYQTAVGSQPKIDFPSQSFFFADNNFLIVDSVAMTPVHSLFIVDKWAGSNKAFFAELAQDINNKFYWYEEGALASKIRQLGVNYNLSTGAFRALVFQQTDWFYILTGSALSDNTLNAFQDSVQIPPSQVRILPNYAPILGQLTIGAGAELIFPSNYNGFLKEMILVEGVMNDATRQFIRDYQSTFYSTP